MGSFDARDGDALGGDPKTRDSKSASDSMGSAPFLELMDCVDELVLVIDPELRVAMANRCATAFSGYSEGELATKRLPMLVEAGERRRMERLVRGSKERRGGEVAFLTRSRKKVRVSFSVSPLAGSGEAPRGYLFVGRLANSAYPSPFADPSIGLADRILAGIPDPAFVLSCPSRTICDCNEAAISVFGFERGEFVGRPLIAHLAGMEESDRDDAMLRRADETYARIGFFHERMYFIRKNGSPLPCDCFSIPFFKDDGSLASKIVIFFDRSREEKRERTIANLVEYVKSLAPEILGSAPSASRRVERLSELGFTPRQIEITRLVAQGLSSKEIGFRLGIAVPTVKSHLFMIFRKLHVGSRIEFIRLLAEERINIS